MRGNPKDSQIAVSFPMLKSSIPISLRLEMKELFEICFEIGVFSLFGLFKPTCGARPGALQDSDPPGDEQNGPLWDVDLERLRAVVFRSFVGICRPAVRK